jgi:hypothetical protein
MPQSETTNKARVGQVMDSTVRLAPAPQSETQMLPSYFQEKSGKKSLDLEIAKNGFSVQGQKGAFVLMCERTNIRLSSE